MVPNSPDPIAAAGTPAAQPVLPSAPVVSSGGADVSGFVGLFADSLILLRKFGVQVGC